MSINDVVHTLRYVYFKCTCNRRNRFIGLGTQIPFPHL